LGENGAKVYITGRTLKGKDGLGGLEETANEVLSNMNPLTSQQNRRFKICYIYVSQRLRKEAATLYPCSVTMKKTSK
jgi:hypothetical protein